ncbi:nucleoside hydrolase-like isoform X2 [Periplaneta americana]
MVLNLVVDTDVGSDDAMALILCAAAERRGVARVWGVTCVHGNTALRHVCANTLKTLHTLRRLDIPVYRGAATSLVRGFERASNIHGADGFGDFEYPDAPDVEATLQREHAVNYLTRVTAEHPGEVTLLCLGPLTNVALAARMDPAFCSNLKEVFVMGGNSGGIGNVTAAAEFNFYCDPEAAHVVIHNMRCPITIFPWEAAFLHGRLPYEWRKNVLGAVASAQARLMNKVERVMLEQELYGVWARCDPLAAAILLEPRVATVLKRAYVTVELSGEATRGAMVVDHLQKLGRDPNVTLVERVDVELYKQMLLEAFAPEPNELD